MKIKKLFKTELKNFHTLLNNKILLKYSSVRIIRKHINIIIKSDNRFQSHRDDNI